MWGAESYSTCTRTGWLRQQEAGLGARGLPNRSKYHLTSIICAAEPTEAAKALRSLRDAPRTLWRDRPGQSCPPTRRMILRALRADRVGFGIWGSVRTVSVPLIVTARVDRTYTHTLLYVAW